VIQPGGRPGLAHEPSGTVGQELAIEELQRNGAAQARVDGTVDFSHASCPEYGVNAVVASDRAGGSVGSIDSRRSCVTPAPMDRSGGSSVGSAYFSNHSTSSRRSASPAHAVSRNPARLSGSRSSVIHSLHGFVVGSAAYKQVHRILLRISHNGLHNGSGRQCLAPCGIARSRRTSMPSPISQVVDIGGPNGHGWTSDSVRLAPPHELGRWPRPDEGVCMVSVAGGRLHGPPVGQS
jgi:hypothetical protein